MRINKILKLFLPLCMVLLFVACSDSDQEEVVVFPEMQTVPIEAGQEGYIDFDAPSEWRMVSDKAWIRFLVGEEKEEVAVAYGDAGQQRVSIVAKTNGHTFESETALLKMTMFNRTEPIAEVTRQAKQREIAMMVRDGYSGPFVETERLDMAYNGSYRLGFIANYDWKLVSTPDWVEELKNIVGKAGAEVTANNNSEGIYVLKGLEAYEKVGEIVIAPRSGEGEPVVFPISYAGMNADALTVDPARYKNAGVMFSQDKFFCTGTGSDYDPYIKTDDKEITFQITTKNMEYRMALVEFNMNTLTATEISLENSWISCVESADKKGEMTLSVLSENEDTETRNVYLYFLPPYYFENEYKFEKDFEIFDGKVTLKRTALGMAIGQQGVGRQDLDEGFRIILPTGDELLPAPVKVEDPDITSGYGITNIYARSFTRAEWEQISTGFGIQVMGAPKMAEAIWDAYPEWFTVDIDWYEDDGFASAFNLLPYDQLPANEEAPLFFLVPDAYGGVDSDIYGVLKFIKAE